VNQNSSMKFEEQEIPGKNGSTKSEKEILYISIWKVYLLGVRQ